MNVFRVAAQWFFSGLAGGFLANSLIWMILSKESGGKRWEGD